jgi:hypothetical protein
MAKQTHKQLKKTQGKKQKSKQHKVKKTKKSTTPKLKGKKGKKDLKALVDLFKTTIEKSQNISRSKVNFAAKLINLNKKEKEKQNTTSYSKSFQSTYTSINKNGKKSEYGQSILDESTKPFVEIKNLKDGKLTISKIVKN